MSYEKPLRQILKDSDQILFGRLGKIEELAQILLNYVQVKFPYYTPHGFSHSLGVEDNLNWMIPDNIKDKMNSHEIFFLIIAAWMHDWGMIGKPEEDPEAMRPVHHLRTEKYFEEYYEKLSLSYQEATIIGRICRGHRDEDLYSKDFDDVVFGSGIKIRRRFLSALLRIADECDITCNRTPEIVYYNLNPKDKADEEFKKHLSISGVGQLEERHKIYINAIARDPKGAKALRETRDKIQSELDKVKAILASQGIVLDYVDLKLETRGFIDKPIGFEIDKKRIVDLMIGNHLYKRIDVAIRELVANSIDACRSRQLLEPNVSFKVVLRKIAPNILEVEDNGIGMDYPAAKKFLSIIGSSYYSSEEFRQLLGKKEFDPIAKFGIGIMSSFLISEGILVETKKNGMDPCKFTIDSVEQEWKYEVGSLKDAGTRIALKLNKVGEGINLRETLGKYFVASEIPIYYQEYGSNLEKLENSWSFDKIMEKFSEPSEYEMIPKERLRFDTEDYNVIVGSTDIGRPDRQLVLFNHGIYVNSFRFDGLSIITKICVDTKKDLIDLQVSREDVVHNERWTDFLFNLLNSLFDNIRSRFSPEEKEAYMDFIQLLTSTGIFFIRDRKESQLGLEKDPFVRSFQNKILYPIMLRGKLEFSTLNEVSKEESFVHCPIYSDEPLKEIAFISKYIDRNPVTIFNPYEAIALRRSTEGEKQCLIDFILKKKGKQILETDLADILIKNCSPVSEEFKDIIPSNVKLGRFPRNWNPIVAVYRRIIVLMKIPQPRIYLPPFIFWRPLIPDEKVYERSLVGRFSFYLDRVESSTEPFVYVDVEDPFLKKILDMRRNRKLEKSTSNKILRYLKLLSFLHLGVRDVESCLVYLDAVDALETEIAETLGFDRPSPLLERLGEIGDIYLSFLSQSEYYEIKDSHT